MVIYMDEPRINVRTTLQIKRDLAITARLRGLTVSSLINSLAVKAIREEKTIDPKAFEEAFGVPVAPKTTAHKIPLKKEKTATRRVA